MSLSELVPGFAVLHSRAMAYNAGVLVRGKDAVLIDAGLFADEVDQLRSYIYAQAAAPTRIVLTHSHWDHVLGPEYFPGVPVVQQVESRNVLGGFRHEIERQVTEWERQSRVERELPFVMPEPDQTFAEELTFSDLRLMHAPGHAPEALVVWSQEDGVLWAGDMLSDIEIPFVMQSLKAYQATLERLARFDVRVLVPGHGAATKDIAEMRRRFSLDQAYLAQLEQRVARAVEQGWSAREALVVCADMEFRQAESNARPHRLNVETAFLELGGALEPGHEGWNRLQ
ncbi:MAG: MBL fold metallo-hydrolase [candidate division WOR-3 bacterium]|nr:MBL fold metallo-hydrolase [candidate division WOR-3 bacterium]